MFFLIVSGLIIPVIMIVIGFVFKERPPAKINGFAGYRTSRSMKSLEAWTFANKYSGRLLYSYGSVSFAVSAIILFLLRSENSAFIGAAIALYCVLPRLR